MGSKRSKRTQRHFEGQGKEQRLPQIISVREDCVFVRASFATSLASQPKRQYSGDASPFRFAPLRRQCNEWLIQTEKSPRPKVPRKEAKLFQTIYRLNVTALAELGSCMTLSSWSTTSIEDVARSAPNGLRWFQLYVYSDRKATVDLIRRAESMGYEALALTVDTPVLGRRYDDVRNRFALPRPLRLENFLKKMEELSSGVQSQDDSGLAAYVAKLIDPSLNWETVAWLMSVTRLPIVLKGVLTGEDARKAVELGVAGIWVSNHGARQLDGVPATVQLTTHLQ